MDQREKTVSSVTETHVIWTLTTHHTLRPQAIMTSMRDLVAVLEGTVLMVRTSHFHLYLCHHHRNINQLDI